MLYCSFLAEQKESKYTTRESGMFSYLTFSYSLQTFAHESTVRYNVEYIHAFGRPKMVDKDGKDPN